MILMQGQGYVIVISCSQSLYTAITFFGTEPYVHEIFQRDNDYNNEDFHGS